MSVAEIIEQIKALPLEDQREVARLVGELTERSDISPNRTVRYATNEQARAAGDRVLEEHVELFRKLAE